MQLQQHSGGCRYDTCRHSDVTPDDVNCNCCRCRICAREDRSLLTAALIYFSKLIRRKDIYGLCRNVCSEYENGHEQWALLILTKVQKKTEMKNQENRSKRNSETARLICIRLLCIIYKLKQLFYPNIINEAIL